MRRSLNSEWALIKASTLQVTGPWGALRKAGGESGGDMIVLLTWQL